MAEQRTMGGQVQEMGADGNWHAIGFSEPPSAYLGSTKVNYDASGQAGNYSPQNGGEIVAPGTPGSSKIAPVTMIDTGSAIKQVNQQKSYLDSNYPSAQPAQQPQANQPSAEASTTNSTQKAYFSNANGQEAEYTQDQLNDPTTQSYLKNNGFALTKSDGMNVNPDFSVSSKQAAVDKSSQAVEDLVTQMGSWNVDNDFTFQNQANAIRGDFAQLKSAMQKTNEQRQKSLETLGYRIGATQYADSMFSGIVGEEITQGANRLSDIARDESAAISAARLAYQNGKWSDFDKKVSALKDIRDQKQKELENFNKALVDATTKAQEQQKFNFEVYKFQQEQKSKDKPLIVAPGSSIYDPNTFELVGTAPERPSDNKPITEKVGNNLIQWNPTTQGWDNVWSAPQGSSEGAVQWAKFLQGGGDIGKVPNELQTEALSLLQSMPPDQTKIAPLQDKIDLIANLKTSTALNSSVGTNFLGRLGPIDRITGERQNFIAGVQQLISQDTLSTLINLKAQGGTLGALSDGERQMLQSAASKISTWAIKDRNGNVTGYNTSEKLFKTELDNIAKVTQRAIDKAGGGKTVESVSKAIDNYYVQNPDKRQYIDSLSSMKNPATSQPYTDEEKAQILGVTFNQVGGDTKLATKVAAVQDGTPGGQCGRFVNKYTGLGLGDSYASKMAKMDKSIISPQPGMVFVMPSGSTGHTGIILSINNGMALVKDSNYGYDETIKTHLIPVNKMTGFARV